MKLYFVGKTNHDEVMVNSITFKLQDGTLLDIDRNQTEYDVFGDLEQNLYMVWREVYVWDGEKEVPVNDPSILKEAMIHEVNIEDDAPENYVLVIDEWHM